MAKSKRTSRAPRPRRALTLKVAGQIRPGRIAIPDLLVICEHVQQAIDRQAEAMEGSLQTQRRGPAREKVRAECTLELAGLRHGSPTTTMAFELSKPQQALPLMVYGEDVIAKVAGAIASVARGHDEGVDRGVLDSLNHLGDVFDRRKVRSIDWIVPRAPGRRPLTVRFNDSVRRRVANRLRPPAAKPTEIEGVIEMADFNVESQRCRVHPVFGSPIPCSFDETKADAVLGVMRKPARISGRADVNAQTGMIEQIAIESVTPIDPLALGADFFKGHDFEELARLQGVEPIHDIGVLAGGWPDDQEPDEMLTEIYEQRR